MSLPSVAVSPNFQGENIVNQKTKVAHIITMLELGGAQQNTLFTVEHLSREAHDVILICGPGGILDEAAKKIPNLRVYFVKSLVRQIAPIDDLTAILKIKKILEVEKPDVVHTHSSKAGIVGRIAARWAKTKIIVHSIHGFGFNPYQKFIVRALFIGLEKLTALWTHALVAVSAVNIEQGVNLGIGHQSQYVLIRSGVDLAEIRKRAAACDLAELRRELGLGEKQKVVLTIGPFKLQKDPLAYVRLAATVTQKIPDVCFLFVGDGELRGEMESEIKKLRLSDSAFKLLGWRKNIPELLKLCDVFVLTSLWEGLPRSGVEALLVGRPVVAFAVDGVSEIVKNDRNGFLLPPGAHAEMASRLMALLSSKAMLQEFSANALNSIGPDFDIRGMVRSQEMLYYKLLKKARS